MFSLKIMIAALSILATQAFADSGTNPVKLPDISCGDHWFEIEVEFTNDVPSLTIKGDSVRGEAPIYTPNVKVIRDDVREINTYAFFFGDSPESAQTLVASFKFGKSYGEGIYSLVEHDLQTSLNCLLK